jgi:hypothetical protein
MVNAVHKGKRGEKEFCNWILLKFGYKVERNYNQAEGGADVMLLGDFLFEVKRRETLDLDGWWQQVVQAKLKHDNQNLIPCVAYRVNGQRQWSFLVSAKYIGGSTGWIMMNEKVFVEFAKTIVKKAE